MDTYSSIANSPLEPAFSGTFLRHASPTGLKQLLILLYLELTKPPVFLVWLTLFEAGLSRWKSPSLHIANSMQSPRFK